MKTRVLFVISILVFSFPALTYKNGAPAGKTGSPKSNNNTCFTAYCHSGPSASSETISISSNIPTDGFISNTDYSITVTSKSNGASIPTMGFESSIESLGQHQGVMSGISGISQLKSTNFITHTSGSNSPSAGEKSWSFIWNSGSSPDSVIVYAAGIFANGNNAPSGDVLLLNTQTLKKNTLSVGERFINPLIIYPNPANNYINIANQKANQKGTIILRNLSGKTVLKSDWKPIDQVGKLIDVSELPNGWYHLHLVLENGQKFEEKLNISH